MSNSFFSTAGPDPSQEVDETKNLVHRGTGPTATAALLLLLLMTWTGTSFGQVTGARLEGYVRDASGAAMPGVEIAATNQDTGLRRTAVTGENGLFRILGLTPGRYHLMATLQGFEASEVKEVFVEGSADITVNLVMKVADLQEAVTVTGELEVGNTLRSVLSDQALDQLPISGRRVQDFAFLTPSIGLDYGSLRAGDSDAISFYGFNERYKSMYLDGVDLNDELTGGGTVLTDAPRTAVSMEAVDQFEVLKNNFSAEIGRNMTGAINLVTKSGTNRLSATGFFFWRDDAFDKPNYFARNRDPLPFRQFQGGANFGGPIKKDRTHYFFSWEHSNNTTSDFVLIPPALLGYLPDTRTEIPLTRTRGNYFLKIDQSFKDKNQLSLSFIHDRRDSTNQANLPNAAGDARYDDIGRDWMFTARLNSVLGARTVNDFRASITSSHERFSVENPTPHQTFPGIAVGTPTNLPQRRTQVPTVIGNVLSQEFTGYGSHFVKFGGEAVINHYPTNLNLFQFGQFVFALAQPPSPTNPPIQYLLGDYAYDFADLNSRYFALFVQDDWRPRPDLTFNLGLRWDIHQYRGTYSGEPFPDFASETEAIEFLIRTLPGGSDSGIRYRMRRDPSDLVQPRAGVTWDLLGTGRTVLRGGYGRFVRGGHDPISVTGVLRAERAQLLVAPGAVFDLLSFFPNEPPDSLKEQFFSSSIVSQFPGVFVKDAFSHQGSIGLDQRLVGELSVGLDYSIVRARNVPREENLNHPDETGTFPYLPSGAPLTVQRADGVINSTILTARAERRFDQRLGFTAWYTWMKTEGDGPSTSPYLRAADYGPMPNEVRHSAAISWYWEVPFGIWLSGVTRAASAFPYNITAGVDTTGDRVSTNDRPPGVTYDSERGDSFFTQDLRVTKRFRFGESTSVEVLGEVFNLFNTTNFISYIGSITSPFYQQPAQAAQPLQGQLGVRVRF